MGFRAARLGPEELKAMPDDVTSTSPLRLKVLERILTLGLAGNLAASTFAYNAARQLNPESRIQQLVGMNIKLDTIPLFVEGAEFSMIGLGAVWLVSALFPHKLLVENGGQLTSPAAKFDCRKAITVFATCVAIGSGFVMTKDFITGINDLTQADRRAAFDLEALIGLRSFPRSPL